MLPIPASVGASLTTVVEIERPSAASEDEQTLAARAQPSNQVAPSQLYIFCLLWNHLKNQGGSCIYPFAGSTC